MKKLLHVVYLTLCLIGITPAYAGDTDMVGEGPGFMLCQKFNATAASNPIVATGFYFWAQGFMTATNVGHAATGDAVKSLSSIPVEQQQRMIRAYCLRHPTDEYWRGVADVYAKMDDATAADGSND